MRTILNQSYYAPELRMVQLCIERGFEASLEDPEFDEEIDW